MTLKQITNGALPVVAGLSLFALGIRFFGNMPYVQEIKEGLKGNVKA